MSTEPYMFYVKCDSINECDRRIGLTASSSGFARLKATKEHHWMMVPGGGDLCPWHNGHYATEVTA